MQVFAIYKKVLSQQFETFFYGVKYRFISQLEIILKCSIVVNENNYWADDIQILDVNRKFLLITKVWKNYE